MNDAFDMKQIKPRSILDPEGLEMRKIKPDTQAEDCDIEPEEKIQGVPVGKKKGFSFNGLRRRKKMVFVTLGVLLFLTLLFGVLVLWPAWGMYKSGTRLYTQAQVLQASVAAQNINIVESEVTKLENELMGFEKAFKRTAYLKYIPVLRTYWHDGEAAIAAGKYGLDTAQLSIETIKPYADVIGFAGGAEAKSGEETANDRIDFIVKTIEGVLPKMDEISQNAAKTQAEISKIDPKRYPKTFRGREVRSKLKNAISLAGEMAGIIVQSKPLMEAAPYLLGINEERTYLVLFQNDKELRPTGGFITAYSIMTVNDGKFNQVSSSDIYNLDDNYTPRVDAPKPIVDYLKGAYLINDNYRLRDMNWNPDFRASMELFLEEARRAGIDDIDGVVAVDTHVVVNILNVIGPIGVPGFGNFSTEIDERCNCPQVIYELESFADVEGPIVWSENEPDKIIYAPDNYENRKKIVGPLMNSIISNALGQEKEKLPDLFMAGLRSVNEKHVLVYVFDDKAQAGVESFDLAGKIKNSECDYLHINDANLGGRKSNLYVTEEVAQDIEIAEDGSVSKTLTITYKNPQDYDGWLNSVLPNWTRIYIPEGSEILGVEGFEDPGETYVEHEKTVISGGFELRPQGVKKIIVSYKLPFKLTDEYKLLIQKQPGKDKPLYTINIGGSTEEFFLATDSDFRFDL